MPLNIWIIIKYLDRIICRVSSSLVTGISLLCLSWYQCISFPSTICKASARFWEAVHHCHFLFHLINPSDSFDESTRRLDTLCDTCILMKALLQSQKGPPVMFIHHFSATCSYPNASTPLLACSRRRKALQSRQVEPEGQPGWICRTRHKSIVPANILTPINSKFL